MLSANYIIYTVLVFVYKLANRTKMVLLMKRVGLDRNIYD
jgi:hypothetical protein